mmetsp:Transcript_28983/g.55574  ORF Transcript_28983/g.55574 Transcript_28983/m.55574 type:complete len:360 (-) Transcript_28983:1959-3038(-)
MTQKRLIERHQIPARPGKCRFDLVHQIRVWGVGSEMHGQLVRDVPHGRRMRGQIGQYSLHRLHIVGIGIGLAQDRLGPRLHIILAEFEPVAGLKRHAGKKFRQLRHVLLGIGAIDAQRVQFHHFARQVFVQTGVVFRTHLERTCAGGADGSQLIQIVQHQRVHHRRLHQIRKIARDMGADCILNIGRGGAPHDAAFAMSRKVIRPKRYQPLAKGGLAVNPAQHGHSQPIEHGEPCVFVQQIALFAGLGGGGCATIFAPDRGLFKDGHHAVAKRVECLDREAGDHGIRPSQPVQHRIGAGGPGDKGRQPISKPDFGQLRIKLLHLDHSLLPCDPNITSASANCTGTGGNVSKALPIVFSI